MLLNAAEASYSGCVDTGDLIGLAAGAINSRYHLSMDIYFDPHGGAALFLDANTAARVSRKSGAFLTESRSIDKAKEGLK